MMNLTIDGQRSDVPLAAIAVFEEGAFVGLTKDGPVVVACQTSIDDFGVQIPDPTDWMELVCRTNGKRFLVRRSSVLQVGEEGTIALQHGAFRAVYDTLEDAKIIRTIMSAPTHRDIPDGMELVDAEQLRCTERSATLARLRRQPD